MTILNERKKGNKEITTNCARRQRQFENQGKLLIMVENQSLLLEHKGDAVSSIVKYRL
jgi:hypothetical protein